MGNLPFGVVHGELYENVWSRDMQVTGYVKKEERPSNIHSNHDEHP